MKKKKCIPALVALTLILSACGGKADGTTAGGNGTPAGAVTEAPTNAAGKAETADAGTTADPVGEGTEDPAGEATENNAGKENDRGSDEPLTRKEVTEEGQDTPLTRVDATEQMTEDPSGSGDAQSTSRFDALLSENAIWAEQDEEIKQELIAEAKKEGMEITFGTDGTTKVVDREGSVSIQNPDGSWNFQNNDGSVSQYGGDWPENEMTKLVPKPSFTLMASNTEETEFSVVFSGADIDQIREYVKQVKESGFDQDENVTDQELQGVAIYAYEASNGNGYRITVFSSAGTSGMTITKE